MQSIATPAFLDNSPYSDLCNPYQSMGGLLRSNRKLDQEMRIPAFVTIERLQL